MQNRQLPGSRDTGNDFFVSQISGGSVVLTSNKASYPETVVPVYNKVST